MNDDFFPNQPRYLGVSYTERHLNVRGELTNERIGAPDYKICWLNTQEQEEMDMDEEKIISLSINDSGLFCAILAPEGQIKTHIIPFDDILSVSLNEQIFKKPTAYLVFAEITKDKGIISLKSTIPFSEVAEEGEPLLDLQGQCTAIIDRLINAVYAQIYLINLPPNFPATEQDRAKKDAEVRYHFYIRSVKKLYEKDDIPNEFKNIFDNAIKIATFDMNDKILRYPIRVGSILSRLNKDFVLNNHAMNGRWLVYNKPYLDFLGNTIVDPISTYNYQVLSFTKCADRLDYIIRSPTGEKKRGSLSFDNILSLVKFEQLECPDDFIYVQIRITNEPSPPYCYSFIMQILSHPIVQVVAIALLVFGAALALSDIAVGIGAGMALVGTGVLIAGFFAPKRTPETEIETPMFSALTEA